MISGGYEVEHTKKYSELIDQLRESGSEGCAGKSNDLTAAVRKHAVINGDPQLKGTLSGWFAVSGSIWSALSSRQIPLQFVYCLALSLPFPSLPNVLSAETFYDDFRRREGEEKYETPPPSSASHDPSAHDVRNTSLRSFICLI